MDFVPTPEVMFWVTYTLVSAWIVSFIGLMVGLFIINTPYIIPLMLLAWLILFAITSWIRGDI